MAFAGNYYYRCDLTCATLVGGVKTTKTISFVNKPLRDSTSLSQFWPILLDVGTVSFVAGEVLPTLVLSSVTINNDHGTFGACRRFQDVLQRYTVIDQTITVYFAEVDNLTDTVSAWTQIATGQVSDVKCALRSDGEDNPPTLTFNVRPYKFDERVMTLEVSRNVSSMTSAPDSSLGRAVPLLIGTDLEVLPIRISADGGATAAYAIGTCLYNHLRNKHQTATPQVWTKNDRGQWEQVQNNFTDRTGATAGGDFALSTYPSRAFGVGETGKTAVCVGVELRCQGNGLGTTSDARLTVFLLQYDLVTFQAVEVSGASGTVDLSLYDTDNNAGTADFAVKVSFTSPVFLSAAYGYAIGWSATGVTADDLSILYVTVASSPQFRKDPSDPNNASGFDWDYITGSISLRAALRTLTPSYSDHIDSYTQQGLTFSRLSLSCSNTVGTGQTDPPLDGLPVGLRGVSGLADYGTVTVVSKPQELIDKLSYTWDLATATWSASNTWDTSTLSASHYAYLYDGGSGNYRSRIARGVIDQKATFSQVVGEIARGTASRVGLLTTGKAFLYPFGVTATPVTDIPACDITGLEWQIRDSSNIVNRAVINLGRRYLIGDADSIDNPSAYVYSTDYSANNFTQVAAITDESRKMFGNRELAPTSFPVYPVPSPAAALANYLGDANSYGSVVAEYYLARYGKPLTYASFVVPYHRYGTLNMFNVITFSSTDFPAYYGTDPEAKPWCVDVAGAVTALPGWNSGEELVRAQTYRGLIEEVSLVLAMEHAPGVKLTVLVLLNQPYDPT